MRYMSLQVHLLRRPMQRCELLVHWRRVSVPVGAARLAAARAAALSGVQGRPLPDE